MSLLFGIFLIICTFISGTVFWSLTKAKSLIARMLKTPNQLNAFVSHLFADGFFDKKAEDISATGGMWDEVLSRGGGYDVLINIEIRSSATSLNTPRNIFAVFLRCDNA